MFHYLTVATRRLLNNIPVSEAPAFPTSWRELPLSPPYVCPQPPGVALTVLVQSQGDAKERAGMASFIPKLKGSWG